MASCAISNTIHTVTFKTSKRISPYNGLFGWNSGNKLDNIQPPQQPAYHDDVQIPFSLSLVNKTFLKGRELKCCYKASIDGFSATKFHERCDFKGPCVIIAYTKDKSFKFGGFNPEGYRSTDDYYDTFDAFLFYWLDGCDDPIVLPKVGGSGAALFDYARGGPQFGADGLLIGPPLAPVMGGFADHSRGDRSRGRKDDVLISSLQCFYSLRNCFTVSSTLSVKTKKVAFDDCSSHEKRPYVKLSGHLEKGEESEQEKEEEEEETVSSPFWF